MPLAFQKRVSGLTYWSYGRVDPKTLTVSAWPSFASSRAEATSPTLSWRKKTGVPWSSEARLGVVSTKNRPGTSPVTIGGFFIAVKSRCGFFDSPISMPMYDPEISETRPLMFAPRCAP